MASVSVIIPTCERPLLLQRALRSVAAQTFVPCEVIVVDDGPSAGREQTEGIIAAAVLQNVRLVTNTRSKGASGSRNSGADCSRQEWLAFLDDDDEWLPAYLATALAAQDCAALDVICTDLLYRYEGAADSPGKTAPDRLAPELFLHRNPGLVGSNLIIRRSLFAELGGFDETLPSANDMDFGLRMALHGAARYAPVRERLVRHYQHGGARLTAPRSPALREGIRRFFTLHAPRMSEEQKEKFRHMALKTYGVDEFGTLLES